MAKSKTQFVCDNCAYVSSKWSGRCDNCHEWNTLRERELSSVAQGLKSTSGVALRPQSLASIRQEKSSERLSSGISDIDHALGGGFVEGSVNLISGEPGIGKSTLLLQIAHSVGKSHKVLYVSAEESAAQIKLRADRILDASDGLEIATSTSADDIAQSIADGKYDLVIVDSIQTVSSAASNSSPGSVSQISNSAQLITSASKASHTATILVGHVTKEGNIAGPKLLEHLVDVVLYLEGERFGSFKVFRSIKNRYGSTHEAAMLEMGEKGLTQIDNPSKELLKERQVTDGSIVLATMEGSRPLLVEIQALVNPTSFGYPKRTSSGIELNRVNLLIAMLNRRTKLNLSDKDVFVNVVGGIRIDDPGSDLAVCMAIASATKGMKMKKDVVVFGELGLSGEVRQVQASDKRIDEARKIGFSGSLGPKVAKAPKSHTAVSTIKDALNGHLAS